MRIEQAPNKPQGIEKRSGYMSRTSACSGVTGMIVDILTTQL